LPLFYSSFIIICMHAPVYILSSSQQHYVVNNNETKRQVHSSQTPEYINFFLCLLISFLENVECRREENSRCMDIGVVSYGARACPLPGSCACIYTNLAISICIYENLYSPHNNDSSSDEINTKLYNKNTYSYFTGRWVMCWSWNDDASTLCKCLPAR